MMNMNLKNQEMNEQELQNVVGGYRQVCENRGRYGNKNTV